MSLFNRILDWFRPAPKLTQDETYKVLSAAYRQMVDDASGVPSVMLGERKDSGFVVTETDALGQRGFIPGEIKHTRYVQNEAWLQMMEKPDDQD